MGEKGEQAHIWLLTLVRLVYLDGPRTHKGVISMLYDIKDNEPVYYLLGEWLCSASDSRPKFRVAHTWPLEQQKVGFGGRMEPTISLGPHEYFVHKQETSTACFQVFIVSYEKKTEMH